MVILKDKVSDPLGWYSITNTYMLYINVTNLCFYSIARIYISSMQWHSVCTAAQNMDLLSFPPDLKAEVFSLYTKQKNFSDDSHLSNIFQSCTVKSASTSSKRNLTGGHKIDYTHL